MRNERELQPAFNETDLVHRYTRAQALADGVLVNVTTWVRGTTGFAGGFTVPVAITTAIWADVKAIPARLEGVPDVRGRAHDVLFMASLAARRSPRISSLLFWVYLHWYRHEGLWSNLRILKRGIARAADQGR